MKLSSYQEDPIKQDKGSPCYLDEGSFDVRRIHTPSYVKELEEIKKQLYGFAPKEIDNNLVLAHWLCEYGVTGWDGVLNPDESELEYSKENARKVFLNPALFLSLNALLIHHASDYNNYLHDQIEEDIKAVKKN